uniref:Milk fat globule-EGF factor 8 protein a n=1 Tax=Sinocyclocheilus grahami TaxID=75366 RepID=A0A672L469_SINGR
DVTPGILQCVCGHCNPNPCKNDGTCEVISNSRRGDVFNEYVCKCQPGFEGAHCHISCISLLGMEEGGIIESQISASSVHSGILGLQHWGPELARLNNQGLVNAWSSAPQDKNPWIEVRQSAHLLLLKKVHLFKTVAFDPSLAVHTMPYHAVEKRHNKPSSSCTSLLGMEEGGIVESQISASSVHSGILGLQHWGPELARLNNQGLVNAWSSAPQDKNPWIEVCQSKKMRLTGIITQGASRMGTAEFVKAFKVASSFDGKSYTVYRADGQRRDKNTFWWYSHEHPPFFARFVRFLPWEWHERITLRMELLGCDD